MGLFNLGGGSAGASLQLPESDGYLVNIGGNLVTVELDAVWPARIKNPGARGGHSLFEVRPWLGEARDLDLATTGDKPIRIEAFMSVFREIIVGLTTDTPVGCVASIWTGPNKTGDKLTDLSADNLSTLVSLESDAAGHRARPASRLRLHLSQRRKSQREPMPHQRAGVRARHHCERRNGACAMRDVNGFPKIYAIINEACQPARVIKVETLNEGELLPEQYRGMRAIQILDEAPVEEGWTVTEMGEIKPQ